MLLELTCFGFQEKRRNSNIVKLLSICSWKGWHYLRYLKLCKEHQGKMPCYMPQKMLGQSIETGQRRRWSWTKVQEAFNCCHIREQWKRPRNSDGGSTTVSSPEGSQVGYFTGASRNILTKNLGLRMVPAQWVPHLLSQKTEAQSLTMCAGNLEILELIKATFGHYL